MTNQPLPTDHAELDRLSEDPTISLCWGCCEIEPIPRNTYIICFECGHVWTKHKLRKARRSHYSNKEKIRNLWWVYGKRTKQIFFCPMCIHDF